MNCIICIVSALYCLNSAAAAQTRSAAPEDETRALLERTCTKCHKLTGTLKQRNSKEGWAAIVDDMIARGAEASDAEIDTMVEYLARNFGPRLKVNKATADELAGVLELPKAAASTIVEFREKNGLFKNWEDLRKVPAIDWKTVESKKDRLDFAEVK